MGESVARLYRELLREIGEDPGRAGLCKTPERAEAAIRFLTSGYAVDVAAEVNGALYPAENEQLVIVRSIEFYSLCEHHILPFMGQCHVAYQPAGNIIGLSKIPRIVEAFARRLQVQERLTEEIAEAVRKHSRARGVGVILEAKHLCMMMRGVMKQFSSVRTSCFLGTLKTDPALRDELLRGLPDNYQGGGHVQNHDWP